MERLIIFFLSTASIAWIFCKSKLFMTLRMAVTTKAIHLKDVKSLKAYFYWYIDSILNCVGCCGVYTAFFSYCILYRNFSLDIIVYSLSGAIVSLILNSLIQK